MRNALQVGNLIVTTDNAGGIGEKKDDLVFVQDEVTARFATRVALLEQWTAYAEPTAILIHNFSGEKSWDNYVRGVTDIFRDICIEVPQISGSTETNMPLNQSAIAVTMIGRKTREPRDENLSWFTYGAPLVGEEVIEQAEKIASLPQIHEAIKKGLIEKIWPVGSHGILYEVQRMTKSSTTTVKSIYDLSKSAGPSTVVLIGIPQSKLAHAKVFFDELLQDLMIITE